MSASRDRAQMLSWSDSVPHRDIAGPTHTPQGNHLSSQWRLDDFFENREMLFIHALEAKHRNLTVQIRNDRHSTVVPDSRTRHDLRRKFIRVHTETGSQWPNLKFTQAVWEMSRGKPVPVGGQENHIGNTSILQEGAQ